MQSPPKYPSWLTFVNRAPDDAPLLRLMVLNPLNDVMSPIVNRIIEADPPLLRPTADGLHTDADGRTKGER
jgi:hypothetical protein